MKNLIEIIKANPGCVATVDNDWWGLFKSHPDSNPHGDTARGDLWAEENELITSLEVDSDKGGYGSGSCYGGDLLQALSTIVGIKVVSV